MCVCLYRIAPSRQSYRFATAISVKRVFLTILKSSFPLYRDDDDAPLLTGKGGYRLCINLHMEIGNARASFQNSQSHFQSYFNKIVSESCESPTIRGWIFLDPSDGISQPFWDGKSNPTHPRDQSYVEILLHVSIRYCHPLWSTRRTIYR